MKRLVQHMISALVLIFLWFMITTLNILPSMVLPGPLVVLKKAIDEIIRGDFLLIWVKSILVILVCLFLCIIFALVLAFIADRNKVLERLMATLSTLLHPLPGVAILPLMIHWFGPGLFSVLAVMVHSVFWPVYLNLSSGIKHIPKVFKELALQYEIGEYEKVKAIYIPAILPNCLTAAKIGWSRAWRSLISAEMIFGAIDGRGAIGWYLFEKRVFGDIAGMIFALIIIMLTGLLIEKNAFNALERMTIGKWSESDVEY